MIASETVDLQMTGFTLDGRSSNANFEVDQDISATFTVESLTGFWPSMINSQAYMGLYVSGEEGEIMWLF